ncbi:Gfo/Idh/MocA family oxidoreductase [Alkaliphilus pronyensis]|uniref:Gfo/Idh/MocA family oxidoreductase n=1 Tax=Alkaliphilus pronyensis TaxID=1482732 RepID=A0A6I0FA74_9FIRM|nr:Gfo/Idh/MocA family oxidoreductase [Alkaliphilus pronyensis]KAB3537312.1 Gfo/Idh/MocA family oxidoreductase [Alkaliphilus pronyensis]
MKIGVVGCGRISKTHFEAINKLSDISIIGCCDIDEEKAKNASLKYSIPFWTTKYEELLKLKEVELVTICTPSGLHPSHGIMAAGYDKNVLTEKPMAVKLSDADKLINACNENNVKLYVVFQNRLNPTIQLVKKAIEEGRFGKIYMLVANVFWTRPQEYYDLADWRGTWKYDGGAFCNQASHYVDLIQWLGGPVEAVYAKTETLARRIEAEDTGIAILKFKSGAIASLNVTMLTYPQNLEGSILIIGERGTVRVGGIAANEILYWRFSQYHPMDDEVNSVATNPKSVYGFGHMDYYKNLINTIKQGKTQAVDGIEGRRSLEIIEAIYISSQQQRLVLL